MTTTDEERTQARATADEPLQPVPEELPIPGRDDDVAALFDDIAPVYDRLSRIVSFGRDRRWRAAALAAAAVQPGDAVVDCFAGTGRMAAMLADRVGPFGKVVAVDFSSRMVERGATTTRDLVQLEFLLADVRELPLEDDRFDAATVSFGLRTLPDMVGALSEMRRVVRPAGRVVALERVMPSPALWGRAYRATVRRLVPIAGSMAGRRGAYQRLVTSIDHVPEAAEVADAMRSAGFGQVTQRRFWFGAVGLFVGVVPPAGG
jgi:demethylmenaquinone methyltransferase/2-methoxy-6-polyprenyl-1,4-benzoquinol methylase